MIVEYKRPPRFLPRIVRSYLHGRQAMKLQPLLSRAGLSGTEVFSLCVEDGRVCHAEVINHDIPFAHRLHRSTKWVEVSA